MDTVTFLPSELNAVAAGLRLLQERYNKQKLPVEHPVQRQARAALAKVEAAIKAGWQATTL